MSLPPATSERRDQPQSATPTDDRPLISVVTPSYNQGPYIARCIESVLAQDYPNFEHIVFDNCSSDETLEVLRRHTHIDWTSASDRGQSDALNKAIAKARGEIIAWINADDFYHPGVFDLAARELHRGTGTVAIAGKVELVDPDGAVRETVAPHFEGLDYLIGFWSHPYGLCQPGVLFRREVVEKVGPFRTDLHFAMDYDFWLRLAVHYPVKAVDQTIAGYLLQENSKTVQSQGGMRFWDDMECVSRRYWGSPLSARRRRFAHACGRSAAQQTAAAMMYKYTHGGGFDWVLFWRLLRRRPMRLCDRHVLAALAEQVVGADRWERIKVRCGWSKPSTREPVR